MASSAPRGLRSDHVVTVGIALFSMLFGAGNLIIPPLLALQAGSATPVAMLGFLIAAIGLPVMGFIAVALAGTARELAGRVHPKFGEFFVAAVYLAIGPCLAIPRTSSTAFEMLVPLLPEGVSLGTARLVFAVGFFVVAFALTLRPGVITRVLGRITGRAHRAHRAGRGCRRVLAVGSRCRAAGSLQRRCCRAGLFDRLPDHGPACVARLWHHHR